MTDLFPVLNLNTLLEYIADSKDGTLGNGYSRAEFQSAINDVDRKGGVNAHGKGDGKLSLHDAAEVALAVLKKNPNPTYDVAGLKGITTLHLYDGIGAMAGDIIGHDDVVIREKDIPKPVADTPIKAQKPPIPGFPMPTPKQPQLPIGIFEPFIINKDPIVLDGFIQAI